MCCFACGPVGQPSPGRVCLPPTGIRVYAHVFVEPFWLNPCFIFRVCVVDLSSWSVCGGAGGWISTGSAGAGATFALAVALLVTENHVIVPYGVGALGGMFR